MNLKLVKFFLFAYLIAAGAYVAYSVITQTGLGGYLMDWQLTHFGVAYEKLTFFAGFLLFLLPAAPVFNYIKRNELRGKVLAASGNSQLIGTPIGKSRGLTWRGLLILAAVPTVIAVIAYFIVMYIDRTDQQRQIYKINLNQSQELTASDVKFVELTGVYQADYQYQLETKGAINRSNKYVPLTNADWNAKQPIKYFLYSDTNYNGYIDPQTQQIAVLPNRGTVAGTFSGKLTQDSSPTFVRNEFTRKGLAIASPHYVLERTNNFGDKINSAAQSQMYWLIPVLGVCLSLAILLGGGVGMLARRARGL
jgi:hypothetical protein